MKKVSLPIILIAALIGQQVKAQTNRAFAITSEKKGSYNWTTVREIDLNTGEITKTLFTPSENTKINYEGLNGSSLRTVNTNSIPTENGVAASAYDAKHNRLYFSQMHNNDLRYFDLNSSELKVVVNGDEKYSTGSRVDESNVITRMTIASDGYGYALTNDGTQLIQFSTSAQPEINKLGSLIDSKKNKDISVHTQCTSWGGDLVGDVYGNLYLFTMRNGIFKINIQTREAEFIGYIKNLPTEFTTNGAAADADGNIVISSAISTDNYYKVNLSTLEASVIGIKGSGNVFSTSDLASSNLAYQKNVTASTSKQTISNPSISNSARLNVDLFPNPVVNKTFTLQFGKVPAGNYQLEISDASGRKVITKSLVLEGTHNEQINLSGTANSGLYLVRIVNKAGVTVYTNKVAVQ